MRGQVRYCAAVVALLAPVAGTAHTGVRVFPMYELPTSQLPDMGGDSLEDWEEFLPGPSLDHSDINLAARQQGEPFDTNDIAFRLFLAWHSARQRILVGAEFVDDVADVHEGLQFMVDGDHSGGPYMSPFTDQEDPETRSHAQYYSVDLHAREGRDPLYRGTSLNAWAYRSPWTEIHASAFGEGPSQAIVEMSLTAWDYLGEDSQVSQQSTLVGGRVIGFQLAFPDFDPELEAVYVIGEAAVGSGLESYHENAGRFADAVLITCDFLDCSRASTAVAVDSWGRVKRAVGR